MTWSRQRRHRARTEPSLDELLAERAEIARTHAWRYETLGPTVCIICRAQKADPDLRRCPMTL